MSYDVALENADGSLCVMPEPVAKGGTYALGDTFECDFNITYNYAEVFGSLVRDLHGKSAGDTEAGLQAFVDAWPHAKPYRENYWAPTPGNAKAAIEVLLTFAKQHPDGVWRVS